MNVQQQINQMSVSPQSTIREAMEAIDRGALGAALLIDPGTQMFAGLVTDGDIRRALLGGSGLSAPVREVSRPASKTARAGTSPEQIAAMFNKPVRVVPLLDEEGRVADLATFDQRIRLPIAEPVLGSKELEYVSECVLTGWISSAGKFVTRFEELFASFCEVDHAVAVSNGTVALHLALAALDVGPGDEVIVPSLTFAATANAVLYTGAQPVFADVDAETWTIDPDSIRAQITPRTRAIIPVHLYGHPADMDPIMEIAREHELWVVEDAAEAHGARYRGQVVGSIGHIGCFSFYGNKIVTTGEGGMLTLNDAALDAKARVLRDHGMDKERRYWHPIVGYNYRLTNLQAAIGVAQMERIDEILARRREMAALYDKALSGVPGLVLPPRAEWAEPVCWLYSLLVDDSAPFSRDELIERLAAQGLDARPFFYPLTDMPPYQHRVNGQTAYPMTERLSRQGISLPSSTRLSEAEVLSVAEKVKQALLPEYV